MTTENNISTALAAQFETEVIADWATKGGQFKGLITEKTVKGGSVEFPTLSTIEMSERTAIVFVLLIRLE